MIERVHAAGWADAVGLLEKQFVEHEIAFDPDVLAAAVRGLLDKNRGAILLARDAGTPIGIAVLSYTFTLEHGGKVAWLEELFVEPARRNQQLGTQLLVEAMTLARNEGCVALDLEVVQTQAAAVRLYERHGFGHLHRIRMTRRLASVSRDPLAEPVADSPGGCLCGAIRFRARGLPTGISYCHCSMCRRASGAPASVWATYRSSSVLIVAGQNQLRTFRSSKRAQRSFCGTCGAPLLFRHDAGIDVDVCIGAFDDPAALAPTHHIYDADRLPWFDAGRELARYPAQGPDDPTPEND